MTMKTSIEVDWASPQMSLGALGALVGRLGETGHGSQQANLQQLNAAPGVCGDSAGFPQIKKNRQQK